MNNCVDNRWGGKPSVLGLHCRKAFLILSVGYLKITWRSQSGCLPYSLWGSVNWCVLCLSFYHLESLFPALVSEQALRLDGINGSDIVTEFRTQLVFKDLFFLMMYIHVYMSLWWCVPVGAGAHTGQKRVLDY